MDWHPTEDDLILHYYREAAPETPEAIGVHLAVCSSCAARWRIIAGTLAMADAGGVPDPGADYTDRLWAAIQPRLGSTGTRRTWRPVVILTALAASLLLAVAAGVLWIRMPGTRGADGGSVAAAGVSAPDRMPSDSRERVLLSALTDHFSQTEMLLVELLNAPEADESSPFTFEQASADDLVASGRLYRATAQQTGDVRFASVIDDLESVLVEVARRQGPVSPEELISLRTRIRDDALLFKVRAISTEIHDRQQTWRPLGAHSQE